MNLKLKNIDESDWADMRIRFALRHMVLDHQRNRIETYINKLEIFDDWFPKFLKWEEKFEDYNYTVKNVQTESRIFNHLIDIFEPKAKILNLREDFLAKAFKYNGYTFKLYVGQGSFWRILKGKKVIFQST